MDNKKGDDIVTRNITFSHQSDTAVFAPPPPGTVINSPYDTLEDWLAAICDTELPKMPISKFSFGVFESPDGWLVYLVGENSFQKDQHVSVRIDFKPSFMYFRLPEKEFKNKNPEKVRKQLFMQLEAFSETQKFKLSFLAKAYTAEFNGKTFWYQ